MHPISVDIICFANMVPATAHNKKLMLFVVKNLQATERQGYWYGCKHSSTFEGVQLRVPHGNGERKENEGICQGFRVK